MRDLSAFKGWNFFPVKDSIAKVWTEEKCSECGVALVQHEFVITATEAELRAARANFVMLKPSLRAYQPFAGGPVFCQPHYTLWREGKVLPSEEIA